MRDVRQRQSGKPCSPESRSDAGQSSPVCGPEARDGSPGAETPCQQGRIPSRGPRGDSASGPFPPRRGVRSPRPMAPVCVFKASCLAPRAPSALPVPACSPSWSRRAHLHGPGRSSCLEAVRVATSVLPATTLPLAALRHSRGCQEEERGHFGGPLSCLTHLVSLKAICSGYT